MAKESSFDVVSTVDMQEVDNAFQQAKKELSQRYDLKDSGAEISLDKSGGTITVAADSPTSPVPTPASTEASMPPWSGCGTMPPNYGWIGPGLP